jgi:sulfite reductase (NADPH) flavoprotein alpha-component
MSQIPFIPDNAPFTAEQRQWLNGYLAGYFSNAGGAQALAGPIEPAAPKRPVLILYGSQTGTAEGIARKTAKVAETKGFAPKVLPMEKYDSVDLAAEENVLVITSTYGDGDPPDNAQGFWSWLSADAAPRLEKTSFSVLALGDTNYPQFCEFGKRCDTRLEQLGAKRFNNRVDCDVDYEEAAKGWTEAVFAALGQTASTAPAAPTPTSVPPAAAPAAPGYSRKNPFATRLLVNRKLNRDGSAKEVRHFEIALPETELTYEAGDALGVIPANDPALVSDLLGTLGFDGEEAVPGAESGELPLRLALCQQYDITKPATELLKAIAERSPASDVAPLLDPARREDLKKYLWGREVVDLVAGMTKAFAPAEFVTLLKKLQPRLYSISSSPKAHPGEVHLTVGAVRYESHGRKRGGVCSTFLSDRVNPETTVPVFVQASHGFKLPADLTRPVIMVGPGTGIAPFRAFLEERLATGATGKNWLFFGDQSRATDYLYEETLEAWRNGSHLSRLDLAFSRDQEHKVYVQHRMIEAAAELWAWLQEGAHFYVCGDASRMAKDVDAALHEVCQTAGGLSADAAKDYVSKLKSEKRYQRDVY